MLHWLHSLLPHIPRYGFALIFTVAFLNNIGVSLLQQEQIPAIRTEDVCLDSTIIKVQPDGTGALKKRPASHRTFPGRMHHQDSSGCRECSVRLILKLSPGQGQAGDAPHGRELLEAGAPVPADFYLIMDSAYEGDETLRLARQLGYTLVVPPNPNRLATWDTTEYSAADEMRLSGSSGGSKPTVESLAASTN